MEDLLGDDRPVHIVGAEVQGSLSDARGHHDPVRLHVREVVEHQPRHRDLTQVFGRRRLRDVGESRVLGMERQRNERHESAGLVLRLAQKQHVIETLLNRLDVAIQHRGVALQPEPVGGPGDLDPRGMIDLPFEEYLVGVVRQDLRAAAGQGAQPRLLEPRQHVVPGHAELLGDGCDLDHGERLHVHLRSDTLHRSDDVEIVVEREIRVHPTHHVDLADRLIDVLHHPALHVLHRQHVCVRLSSGAVKRAEFATGDADVRVVDVLVNDVVGGVAMSFLTHMVGKGTDGEQIRMPVESEPLGPIQTLPRQHLLGNRPESALFDVSLLERSHRKPVIRPARGDGPPPYCDSRASRLGRGG